jgi:DNA segregation ATPase FtsK/SpoIIIE, S-DNA-T family
VSTAPQIAPLDAVDASSAPIEPLIIQRERETLHDILRLVSDRAAAEEATASTFHKNDSHTDQEYQNARRTLAEKFATLTENQRKADEERRRTIVSTAIAGESEAKTTFAKASRRIASEFDICRETAKNEHQRARAEAAAAFEAGEKDAKNKFAAAKRPIDERRVVIESMENRLAVVFEAYQKFGLSEAPTTPTRENYKSEDPATLLSTRLAKLDKPLELLESLFIPRAMKGKRFLWIFVVLFLILVVPLTIIGEVYGAGGAVVAAIALGFVVRSWLYALSRKQVGRLYYPLFQSLVDAEALAAHCMALADERLKEQRFTVTQRRDDAVQKAKEKHTKTITAGESLRDEQLRRINEIYGQQMVDIQTKQQVDLREAIEFNIRRADEIRTQNVANTQKLDEKYRTLKEKIRTRQETSWNTLANRWREGMLKAVATVEEINRQVDQLGPKWDDPGWHDRPLSSELPPVLRLGEIRLDLNQLPGGVPADPRLKEGIPTAFTFPVLRGFPDRANLLLEAPSAGRAATLAILQSAMLRLLTALPAGQVRFTIIDPIGIGRNFGAFMHLADFDESLVNGQVWTDTRDINDRLGELCAHMERVTQKYLRNEYASIEEYNAMAGEVAEPYRIVVVADFPANLDEKGMSRLASLVTGGVNCGILTLLALDRDRPLPSDFDLDAVRHCAFTLSWDEGRGRLAWGDPDFREFPLALDPAPPSDFATRIIHKAGAAAKQAKRVEVPFEFIAPAPDAWWTLDSRAGIDVPLGKAGATKRQNLSLGQGTSQHVLIAGRTGSGKSTLMHALIANLALNYSPDQIDLYLIDFKKGVEFKVYATYKLPHASVVAIESEREFGISVLQRLDAEMRERGEKFRDAGVQDLNGYRRAPGTPPLPRILLIVDEFQEFFVEEDKLAQEAALLLDRLVRQGRAFGVHVLLGSQSLGGAYALARSTLGQMAVRIALQCSESDALMILSEQNTAAQLLSRPGEAIYNDANGQVEGNHFFQVVWLGDDRREAYLKRIQELALDRKPVLTRTPIVFEGDAPADLAKNPLLKSRLEALAWPASPRSSQAWLGDAVAIKDPTSALFRRRGGNHLLIVGQNSESALGIMTAALIGLAAQYPPSDSETSRLGARFFILDGTPEDHQQAGYLTRITQILPHPIETGGWNDTARILSALGQEVERRQQPDSAEGPEIFLLIHDLPQFRDLRKRADDFSFSRRDEDAGPADHLATLIREGSARGVHVIAWCDTLNSLNRIFDHQALREFEMRVLFQMSPNDSGHLLDSPAASKLGPHRAYFSSEEQNRLEKFRPYGLPSEEWLAKVHEQFRKRAAAVGDHV